MFNYNNPYLNNYGGSYYSQQPYGNMQPSQSNNSNNYSQQPSQQNNGLGATNQPIYMPLTFVNGIEEVNKFIVQPNCSAYLRDNNSNRLYIKSCDSTGKYNLKIYDLLDVTENAQNSQIDQPKIDINNFISKDDFKALEEKVEAKFNKIQGRLDKLTNKREEK